MSAAALYRKHTQTELQVMQTEISNDPVNRNPEGGIYMYTRSAQKKLDAIALAITFHLADKREAAGDPVPCNGYSGRQSKRRR